MVSERSLALLPLATLVLLAGCASSGIRSTPATDSARAMSATIPQGYATRGERVAILARDLVGTPYRYGGSSPETGFDCSGLVYYTYSRTGVTVPRSSQDLFKSSRKIPLADAAPGDLIFFQDQEKLSHMGIYLGGRRFVHAPSSGKTVSVAHIDTPYYQQHLIAVGRFPVIGPTT